MEICERMGEVCLIEPSSAKEHMALCRITSSVKRIVNVRADGIYGVA